MTSPKNIRRELDTLKAQQSSMKQLSNLFVGMLMLVALAYIADSLLAPYANLAGIMLPGAVFTLMLWLMALTNSHQKLVEAVYTIHEQTEDIV